MALTKTIIIDKIEILYFAAGYPVIQVREATIISENDVERYRSFHRHVLPPDADVSGESNDVQAIAGVVFTEEAKAKYAAVQAAK